MDIRGTPPSEGVLYCEKDAELFKDQESCGKGDFYITEHDVRFLSENRTIFLQYPSISVHALSRDSGSFPHRPSVFMLINEESIEQVDEPSVSEYHLVANEHNLDHIYSSLCEGQSLNPDEEDMDQQDQGQIDLSGFTWAEGYGPEFLTGAPQVNGGGDATPNIAGLNIGGIRVYRAGENGHESSDDDGQFDDVEEN